MSWRSVLFSEMVFQSGERGLRVGRDQIELGAVAGGDDHAFGDAGGGDEFVGRGTEFRRAHGETFAHFHGRGLVIEAEAEKFHQTNAKTPSERMNNATVSSESRRPVSPRTVFTPNNNAYPTHTASAATSVRAPRRHAASGNRRGCRWSAVRPPSHSRRSSETSNSLTGGRLRNSPLFKWCSFNCRSSTRNITPATAASASAP